MSAKTTGLSLPWVERVLGQRVDPVSKARAAEAVVWRTLAGEPGSSMQTSCSKAAKGCRSGQSDVSHDPPWLWGR